MFDAQLFLQPQLEPDTEHTQSALLYASCSTDSYRLLSISVDRVWLTHTKRYLDGLCFAIPILPLVGLPIRLMPKSAGLRTVDTPPLPLWVCCLLNLRWLYGGHFQVPLH